MSATECSMLEAFDRDGYVVVRGALDAERDLEPVKAEYETLLDNLLDQHVSDQVLRQKYRQLSFGDRLIEAVQDVQLPYDQAFDISLPQGGVKLDTPIHVGPAVFQLLRCDALLDLVEQFIGPEIYSNPVQHTRIKIPESLLPPSVRTGLTGRIAWHQDLGVVEDSADSTDMLTVWFPMTRATVENGCLAVFPGTHRKELFLHCRSQDPLTLNQVCIPERLIEGEGVPLEMEPGDVLFMHRKTQHAGLPNESKEIRWSFDLRYHPIGQATGRSWFPGFVARSKRDPENVLSDPADWARRWHDTRSLMATADEVLFNRWDANGAGCA